MLVIQPRSTFCGIKHEQCPVRGPCVTSYHPCGSGSCKPMCSTCGLSNIKQAILCLSTVRRWLVPPGHPGARPAPGAACGTLGCSTHGSPASTAGTPPRRVPGSVGRGTPACQSFQPRMCDWGPKSRSTSTPAKQGNRHMSWVAGSIVQRVTCRWVLPTLSAVPSYHTHVLAGDCHSGLTAPQTSSKGSPSVGPLHPASATSLMHGAGVQMPSGPYWSQLVCFRSPPEQQAPPRRELPQSTTVITQAPPSHAITPHQAHAGSMDMHSTHQRCAMPRR